MRPVASSLSIGVLGPLSVLVDGQPLAVDTRKATALLAVLAVTGEPQSRESLTALLWPESDGTRAAGALRRTLSVLRTALGGRWVEPSGGSLDLDGPDCEIDIRRERELWQAIGGHHRGGLGAASTCAVCLDRLERVAALHRGPLLAGLSLRDSPDFDDWQRRAALDAERRLAQVLATLVDGRVRQGRLAEALAAGERWLALDVLCEPAHRALMQVRASTGDRAGAIRQYRECVRVLEEELSVEPLEETQALYRQILAGEWSTTDTGPDEPPKQAGGAVAIARSRLPAPLVGRSRQLGALVSAWTAASDGGSLALVEGEPGIGKTRLVEELAGVVRRASGTVISIACFPGDRAQPYAGLAELIRRAADDPTDRMTDLPPDAHELAISLASSSGGPASPDGGHGFAPDTAARAHFLDAASRLLVGLLAPVTARAAPTMLAIDDVQWLDDPTLQLLVSSAPQLRAARTLLVLARRPVSLDPDPLRALARGFEGEHFTRIELDRLTRDETAELARLAGLPPAEGLGLYEASLGLPMHLAEHIAANRSGVEPRSGGSRPEPADEPDLTNDAGLSSAVRNLLSTRLDALSDGGAQVAAAAAIIGRRFDVDLVRTVSGRSDEEVVDALDELLRVGLLRDWRSLDGGVAGEDGRTAGERAAYGFDHPLTGGVVYGRIGLARRRLLHRRAATALIERQSRAQGGSVAGEVARHYRLAGDDGRASAYLEEAGRRAESVWANAEALADYRAAAAIEPERLDALRERMADLELLLGRYESAVADLEAAIARTPATDPASIGRLERKLASVHRRTGRFALADAHAELAMARLPETERAERLATILEQAMLAHRLGERERAARLVGEAMPMADSLGDAALGARAHNMAAIVARASDDPMSAVAHLRRSLDLASSAGSLEGRTAALNNLALVERERGQLEQAVEFTMEALRSCAQLGDRHREAALRNNLADLLRALGRQADAMDQVRQAVTIVAAIGEPGELQPELWRLVEW